LQVDSARNHFLAGWTDEPLPSASGSNLFSQKTELQALGRANVLIKHKIMSLGIPNVIQLVPFSEDAQSRHVADVRQSGGFVNLNKRLDVFEHMSRRISACDEVAILA
jgi:hypothetical protein